MKKGQKFSDADWAKCRKEPSFSSAVLRVMTRSDKLKHGKYKRSVRRCPR